MKKEFVTVPTRRGHAMTGPHGESPGQVRRQREGGTNVGRAFTVVSTGKAKQGKQAQD